MSQLIGYVGRDVTLPCFARTREEHSPEFYWLKWEKNDTQIVATTLAKQDFDLKLGEQQQSGDEYSTKNILFKRIISGPRFKTVFKKPLFFDNGTSQFGLDLSLTNASKNDEGLYTCFVTNNVNSANKTIYLKIEDESKSFLHSP